jgi:FAD synthetase
MAVVPTAAMLVIGDEILKGHTKDTNSSFAARILYRLGVKLSRILVISDDKEQIASEVRALSSQFTFVVTCGGVGPTHDDVTFEAVAAAFDMPLVRSKEMAELVQNFYELDASTCSQSRKSALKMAQVPEQHELLYANESNQPRKKLKWSPCTFPVVKVRNVFVYPGLPICFEACFQVGINFLFESHFLNKNNCDFRDSSIAILQLWAQGSLMSCT